MNREELLQDLTPFCDIGNALPKITEKEGKFIVKMTRDGRVIALTIEADTGKIQAVFGAGQKKFFGSLPLLLASDGFANLRRWSDLQRDFLRAGTVLDKDLIPFHGRTHDGISIESVESVDLLLDSQRPAADSAEVLLLDGPAGIGKTTLIEQLALRRAESYKTNGNGLILHVKSRGRVLSNLQDLMAFSLQTIRLSITYDQVPVLVKHGLVILAIDGFDELGDPSGYELAWGQVNELVSAVRGQGSIILAGRDTFIGRERLLRDVKSLRAGVDVVTEVVLDSPTPEKAKDWLKKTGQWTDASLAQPAISVILEPGSYALRPVFLRLIRDQIKAKEFRARSESDLTAFLVRHMIEREATKFGDAVEQVIPIAKLRDFVFDFLMEVARDMADSQTESVDAVALTWIAEASLDSGVPSQVMAMIKNRVGVLAFLADDDRPGHKRFSHTQIMNYFLSSSALRAVSKGDIPKFLRRNLLGTDLLSTFGDVLITESSNDQTAANDFFKEANSFIKSNSQIDRASRNLGALLLSASPALSEQQENSIGGFQVDEAVIRGTVPACKMHNMLMQQLDVRGADLSSVAFDSCVIIRLISDGGTRVSATFPNVDEIIAAPDAQFFDQSSIEEWLDSHGRKLSAGVSAIGQLAPHPVYKLLGKACRLRQYWLRSEGDHHAARILNDQWWPILEDILRKHDFLREAVDRQASGRPSTFYHLKQSDRLLSQDQNDVALIRFYEDLLAAVQPA